MYRRGPAKVAALCIMNTLLWTRASAFSPGSAPSLLPVRFSQRLRATGLAARPRAPLRLARSLVASAAPAADDKISDEALDVSAYKPKSAFLKTMVERGFLHSCTNIEALDQKLEVGVVTAYLGFDATAPSLHVGSLLQIMILRHLQQTGHKPIVLLGGGTTKVGDPTGKDTSRKMLSEQDIEKNIQGIRTVFDKFLTFGDGEKEAMMVNNDEWLSSLKYLEFLRDYGTLFTINRMLSFESVKIRLGRQDPLTFLEFNYMILQAYDFLELNRRYKCSLQLGGSDQWGNMVNGVELTRRANKQEVFALTAPLITTSDGKKMGKSEGGAMWLNEDMLAPYDYWQFWRNTQDADVGRFLKLFTELPLEKCNELASLEGAAINEAKKVLADECTRMLHGEGVLASIHETAQTLFAGAKGSLDDLPSVSVSSEEAKAGVPVIDLYIQLGFAKSKSECRKLIQGGGARLNDEKIEDMTMAITEDMLAAGPVKLSMGKKKHGLVEVK
mmetsp:Transcript_2220/g.5219  ORF Transcript_2220/g.5219 Transcript_2220/m.5219 type:complete len:500 (-) Transcript_2220:1059-2558(-)